MHNNANCPVDNGTTPTLGLTLDVDPVSLQVSLNKPISQPQRSDFRYSTGKL